jgi:hypothetical protein
MPQRFFTLSTRFRVLLYLFPLLLMGCEAVEVKQQANQFDDTVRSYEASLRWGDLSDIYLVLTPELAKEAEIPPDLENIKVTKVERLGSPRVNEDVGIISLRIHYLFRDRQVIRKLIDRQQWRYSEKAGWRRSNPIPSFN